MAKQAVSQTAPQVPPPPSPIGRRTFYSKASGLVAQVNVGRQERDGERIVRVGQKHASFSPIGGARSEHGGDWGHCITSDPEVIAYLENRAATLGDVFTEQTFMRMSAPAAMREQADTRVIESQNRLIEDLKRQNAELAAAQSLAS